MGGKRKTGGRSNRRSTQHSGLRAKFGVDELRRMMEDAASELRDAIRLADPKLLLAYLWFQLLQLSGEKSSDHSEVQHVILAMEYVHAVHAGDSDASGQDRDEGLFSRVLERAQRLVETTMTYVMVSTKPGQTTFHGSDAAEMILSAKASWVLLRGNRYVPLEEEFFSYALAPHDQILRALYGAGAEEIAKGIQRVAFAMTRYAMKAPPLIEEHMRTVKAVMEKEGISQVDAIKRVAQSAPEVHQRSTSAMLDLLFGEHCNLSKHSTLPSHLLEDIAFEPGTHSEFFAPGELCGTPLRTLPARIRPLVRLSDGYYAADPNFVRDSSYRAIQRAVIRRESSYREEWNRRQKAISESAFTEIFREHLAGARIDQECFYPGPQQGQWSEIDTLITFEDVLVQVEAKAGIAALVSPETNFESHLKSVDRLVAAAYDQCRRFFEYLASASEVPIFRRTQTGYHEVCRLQLAKYRVAIPIGLTMESFTPFSSMSKELSDLGPILRRHGFISLAIDDLFVLRRFLINPGALFHYFEVRQAASAIRRVFVHDEIDHLGSYLQQNRYDKVLLEQLGRKTDFLLWDGYSSAIDEYFSDPDFQTREAPSQRIPSVLQQLLHQLATTRLPGWLRADSLLRNLSGSARDDVSRAIEAATNELKTKPYRAYHVSDALVPITLVIARAGTDPLDERLVEIGSAAALAFRRSHQVVIVTRVDLASGLQSAYMLEAPAPERGSPNADALQAHAANLLAGVKAKAEQLTGTSSPRKLGRNEPCWCGSGRKFKRCHGTTA